MKIKRFLGIFLCTIFFVTGSSIAFAANDKPDPVVKYDFESVSGKNVTNTGTNTSIGSATIIGSGTIVNDAERGKVFYNHAANEYDRTVRTNYLQLDSKIMSDAINGNAFSLTMWMKFDNTKIDIVDEWWGFRWADIFVAYDSDAWNKYPMMKLGVNLIGRVNNTQSNDDYYFDTADMGNYLSDGKWHQIAFTISTSKTVIYVDGKEMSSIILNGGRGQTVGDLFSNTKNLMDVICVGGNSLWNEDPDMCAMFDDICIYNVELTASQISQASGKIDGGVKFDSNVISAGKTIKYTIDSSLINKNNIKSYEWYVGDKKVSTGSAGYTPTANDAENTIKLKVILKDGSYSECSAYYSLFPILYIDSNTSYGSVGWDYVNVNFKLMGSSYTDEQLYDGTAEIKLRGNSTSGLAKRPFKVKLESKTDLLGMGSNKHWVLLADAIDLSLLRNKLLQSLAGDFGLDYMESEYVVLMYNGEYQGIYELSEHVRIGKTRVDIFDWEDLAEDGAKAIAKALRSDGTITEAQYDAVKDALEDELSSDYAWVTSSSHSFTSAYLKKLGKTSTFDMTKYLDFNSEVPKVTGGVLLEMDFWYEIQNWAEPNIKTAYALPIYTNTPDSTEVKFNTLVSYIDKYVQAMEYSLHSTDFVFKNSDIHYRVEDQGWYDGSKRVGVTYTKNNFTSNEYDGWHYTDFLDIDSAINNMLICEISLNWDSMKNSFFMYKDIDGKMIFGPTWDFDWAWGNSMGQDTNAPETWQTTNEWFANEQYYQTVQWNRLFIRDPYFIVKLYERYHEIRDAYFAPMVNKTVKEMSLANSAAAMANYNRWGTAFSATAGQTYDKQVSHIQTFLNKRLTWLDKQFVDVDTLISSLGYYIISDDITTGKIDTSKEKGYTYITAKVDNSKIKKVSFQVNGKNFYVVDVKNNEATAKIPDSVLVTDGGLNVVQFRGMDSSEKYVVNLNGTETGNYTNAISNYTTFKKTISNDVENNDVPGVIVDGEEITTDAGETETESTTEEETSEEETTKKDTDDKDSNNSANKDNDEETTENSNEVLENGVGDKKEKEEDKVPLIPIIIMIILLGVIVVIIVLWKFGYIGVKNDKFVVKDSNEDKKEE